MVRNSAQPGSHRILLLSQHGRLLGLERGQERVVRLPFHHKRVNAVDGIRHTDSFLNLLKKNGRDWQT